MSPFARGRAYASLAARAALARFSPSRPFKVTLALTERCDCRCVGCSIWQKPKGREPTPAEVHDWLRPMTSLRWVNLTGGEPFLREDLPEVAAAVCRALPRLAVLDLPTTGQRTERVVEDVSRIAALRIPRFYVTVSLEGPPEVHDRLRGRPGAFDRATATFAALRAIPGVRTWLGMTLSDANAHLVPAALAAVRRRLPPRVPPLGWRDLHLNVFTTSDHYYANRESPLRPPASLARVLRRALRAREGSGEVTDLLEAAWLRLLPAHLASGRSPLPCASGASSVYVDPAGGVWPCTVWGRRLGSLREATLPEILAGPAAAAARAVIARDACPGCWSPCEAAPTIVTRLPASLLQRAPRGARRR